MHAETPRANCLNSALRPAYDRSDPKGLMVEVLKSHKSTKSTRSTKEDTFTAGCRRIHAQQLLFDESPASHSPRSHPALPCSAEQLPRPGSWAAWRCPCTEHSTSHCQCRSEADQRRKLMCHFSRGFYRALPKSSGFGQDTSPRRMCTKVYSWQANQKKQWQQKCNPLAQKGSS